MKIETWVIEFIKKIVSYKNKFSRRRSAGILPAGVFERSKERANASLVGPQLEF